MTNHSLLAAGVGTVLLAALPVTAAETIFFDYGYASRSLPVSALETFAQTGEVSPELKSYFTLLQATPETQDQFRQALTLPPPTLLDAYTDALTVAFFEVELSQNATYQPYLQAAYTDYLGRDQPFDVFLISADSNDGILQASQEFRSRL
jgi:hypothetical protein